MSWNLTLDNIGGIRHAEADIVEGVTAVRASNWQGKSSFLAGIKTAFGTETPLTEGQAQGRAVLDAGEKTYAVELTRSNGTISTSGKPYLDEEYDRICAELFAFLDEGNAIRQAVREGENLEALLTRPLDFENIDGKIADLRHEREQVERELEQAKDAASRLPKLQETVNDLESTLADLRQEREQLDADPGGDDELREELSEVRAQRDQVATRIERLESTLERFEDTLEEKQASLETLTVPESEDIESELETLHDNRRELARDRELLQSVYESNRRILDEGRVELLTEVSHEVLDDTVTCWLCGSDATRGEVETQLEALDEKIQAIRGKVTETTERIDDLEAKRDRAREARKRRADLSDRIADLESRIAETSDDLASARAEHAELESRIDDLESEVDTTTEQRTSLESEIKYTEAELADARDTLESVQAQADRRAMLDDEYEALTSEIADLRGRKERIKRETREAFTAAIDDILGQFDTGFETARLTSGFDLVVARDGREAQLDALSEGERELLGIFGALAGHEAFDVAERVPVILLDRLGGLASENLQILVEYLATRVEYLVLTAYPEHEPFDGHELSPAEWDVVSHTHQQEAL